jgi:lysophospholipase L1-like esterase
VLGGLAACGGGDDTAWHGAWSAAPQDFNEPIPLPGYPQPVATAYADTTVRQWVRPTVAGDKVRVRLSNVTGTAPVTVSAATLARSQGGGRVDTESLKALTFAGAPSLTLAPGAQAWSDPVDIAARANEDLGLSLYFAQSTPVTTVHRTALRTGAAAPGNVTAQAQLDGAATVTRYHLVTGLDVSSTSRPAVVVAFGDSITDGTASTMDALQRYPDHLARRAAGDAATAGAVSVLNMGIERDVLSQSEVSHVIVLLGINDIGFGAFSGPPFNLISPSEVVTAEQIIEGYRRMLAAARARDVKVLLGTLLPFKDAAYFSEATEAKRQAVNAWIRAQSAQVHAVIDFDRAMASVEDPLALNPLYDSGDHLHPNDAGYAAMAAAVDLKKLLR